MEIIFELPNEILKLIVYIKDRDIFVYLVTKVIKPLVEMSESAQLYLTGFCARTNYNGSSRFSPWR